MSQKPPNSEIDNRRDGQKSQPVLKTQAIALLRFFIIALEGTVDKLEAKPPPEDLPRTRPTSSGWWNAVLRNIRAVLPKFLNQVLSDFALTLGISVAILTLLLWITILISPTSVEESATVEPETPPTETVGQASPLSVEPEEPPTDAVGQGSPLSVETEEPPTDAVGQGSPLSVEIVPAPVLMSEENLVAIIQNQVADSVSEAEYAEGLIQSLTADFNKNLLVVKVSDNWYYISPDNQNEFAQSMGQLSQALDFYKLEITDPEDTLLARSPVVGPKMVIFQRRLVLSH